MDLNFNGNNCFNSTILYHSSVEICRQSPWARLKCIGQCYQVREARLGSDLLLVTSWRRPQFSKGLSMYYTFLYLNYLFHLYLDTSYPFTLLFRKFLLHVWQWNARTIFTLFFKEIISSAIKIYILLINLLSKYLIMNRFSDCWRYGMIWHTHTLYFNFLGQSTYNLLCCNLFSGVCTSRLE